MMITKQIAGRTLLVLILLMAGGCSTSTGPADRSTPPSEHAAASAAGQDESVDMLAAPTCDVSAQSTAGLAEGWVLYSQDGKWGAKNRQGEVVIDAQFDSPFTFHEGLAGVCVGDSYGFIGLDGKWVIEPRFDARCRWHFIGDVCAVSYEGRLAVINKAGEFVWQPGLLRAGNLAGGIYIKTPDGRKGFLDNVGQLLPNEQPNGAYFRKPAGCG